MLFCFARFYNNKSNNGKGKSYINRETGSDEIFTMLDRIQSDTERNIENLLADSDTEFIGEDLVPKNKEESQILTPEATAEVESNVLNESEPPRKKLKQKVKIS